MTTVGVISDTHGLLRPEALAALAGSDLIVHAGDVGDPAILDALRAIAPVRAVRGNVDVGAWADSLPACDVVEVAGQHLYVLHRIEDLDLDPGGFRLFRGDLRPLTPAVGRAAGRRALPEPGQRRTRPFPPAREPRAPDHRS